MYTQAIDIPQGGRDEAREGRVRWKTARGTRPSSTSACGRAASSVEPEGLDAEPTAGRWCGRFSQHGPLRGRRHAAGRATGSRARRRSSRKAICSPTVQDEGGHGMYLYRRRRRSRIARRLVERCTLAKGQVLSIFTTGLELGDIGLIGWLVDARDHEPDPLCRCSYGP